MPVKFLKRIPLTYWRKRIMYHPLLTTFRMIMPIVFSSSMIVPMPLSRIKSALEVKTIACVPADTNAYLRHGNYVPAHNNYMLRYDTLQIVFLTISRELWHNHVCCHLVYLQNKYHFPSIVFGSMKSLR